MTNKSKLVTRIVKAGLMASLLSLPAYAKKEDGPTLLLQQALQRFLQSYKSRLLEVEYEPYNQQSYYEVTFIDAKGMTQQLRVGEKGYENLHQAGKAYPKLPGNLLTIQQILNKTFGKQAVRLLQAELKPNKKGGYQYELEWLDSQGVAWEGNYDAITGSQLSLEKD